VNEPRRLAQPLHVLADGDGYGGKLLAQGHGYGVLELGPSQLEHILELLPLEGEGILQLAHGVEQAADLPDRRELERGGVDVVRGLRQVHVVVGVAGGVVAPRPAQQLQRPVGDHLVGVHVRRRAGAALDDVDDEIGVVPAVHHLVGGLDDGRAEVRRQDLQVHVGLGRRLLDGAQGADEQGEPADGHAGDGEVLDGAQGLHAVIGSGGNLPGAQTVVLFAMSHGRLLGDFRRPCFHKTGR